MPGSPAADARTGRKPLDSAIGLGGVAQLNTRSPAHAAEAKS
jgi:hypothetical protein